MGANDFETEKAECGSRDTSGLARVAVDEIHPSLFL